MTGGPDGLLTAAALAGWLECTIRGGLPGWRCPATLITRPVRAPDHHLRPAAGGSWRRDDESHHNVLIGPVVHAEIRSKDPDATRKSFGDLPGRTYSAEGAVAGCTFVDTGVPDAPDTAISPLQGGSDLVTFFIGMDDINSVMAQAGKLGGTVVKEPQQAPGVSFALIADPQGYVAGLAQQGWDALGNDPQSEVQLPLHEDLLEGHRRFRYPSIP